MKYSQLRTNHGSMLKIEQFVELCMVVIFMRLGFNIMSP